MKWQYVSQNEEDYKLKECFGSYNQNIMHKKTSTLSIENQISQNYEATFQCSLYVYL